jgi:hypothetical protein
MTDFGRHGRASFAVTHNGALWKALSSTGNLHNTAQVPGTAAAWPLAARAQLSIPKIISARSDDAILTRLVW